jgi:hypothetical protein
VLFKLYIEPYNQVVLQILDDPRKLAKEEILNALLFE